MPWESLRPDTVPGRFETADEFVEAWKAKTGETLAQGNARDGTDVLKDESGRDIAMWRGFPIEIDGKYYGTADTREDADAIVDEIKNGTLKVEPIEPLPREENDA